MQIKYIGIVHSEITSTKEMPSRGAPAQVEVFPEFAPGLMGLESDSHVVIVGWMNQANRDVLRLERIGSEGIPLPKGVFAVRSPSRPNPIGISTARLLRIADSRLHLERLDMIDGTPVVDIKGYSFGWDTVFGASSFWDHVPPSDRNPQVLWDLVLTQAENFHGRTCPGVVLGARMVCHSLTTWNVPQRDRDLVFYIGDDGCITDAIQGATGATFGNGRLVHAGGDAFRAVWKDKELTFTPLPLGDRAIDRLSIDRLTTESIDELFDVREGVRSLARRRGYDGFRCEA